MSAHKKLIAEKLAEEEVERKVKGEVKKEKHIVCNLCLTCLPMRNTSEEILYLLPNNLCIHISQNEPRCMFLTNMLRLDENCY